MEVYLIFKNCTYFIYTSCWNWTYVYTHTITTIKIINTFIIFKRLSVSLCVCVYMCVHTCVHVWQEHLIYDLPSEQVYKCTTLLFELSDPDFSILVLYHSPPICQSSGHTGISLFIICAMSPFTTCCFFCLEHPSSTLHSVSLHSSYT